MFKTCKDEYKYFNYNKTYFRIPTFGRETKIIDFARGIINVAKKHILAMFLIRMVMLEGNIII